MTGKKILVTGGAGFIGYVLCSKLSDGNDICIVDNLDRGRADDDFEGLISKPNVTFINLDLTQPEEIKQLDTGFDYIYHLAAVVGVRNVSENPDKVLRINTLSLLNILDFAGKVENLKKFFFSSTSEVYAGTQRHFGIDVPTEEDIPLTIADIKSTRSTYMLTKIFGEASCFNFGKKFNIPFTIGRYHNVYGPRMGFLHVVPETFIKIYRDTDVKVASPGHTRAMCYVDDAVNMTIRACEKEDLNGEVVNIGNSSEEISMKALTEITAEVMGREINIIELGDTPGSPVRRCPKTDKIESYTGYKAQTSLRTGIIKTFEWYKDKLDDKYE